MRDRMEADKDGLQDENARLRRELYRLREEESGSNYSEGGTSWQKWILGILAGIAILATAGGVEMNAQLAAIHQQQMDAILASDDRRREIDRRLESIEQKLSQRGGQ